MKILPKKRTKKSDKEKKIVEDVLDKLIQLQNQASGRMRRYDENKRWFETDKKIMYPEPREEWQATVLANMIEANVRTIVSVLTDSKPIMRVRSFPLISLGPEEESALQDFNAANDNVLNHLWRVNDMHSQLKRNVLDGCLTGNMCGRIFWDSTKYGGLGEIGIELFHSKYLFFDERVLKLDISDGSCDWCILAMPKPLSWFSYHFPGKEVNPTKETRGEKPSARMGLYVEAYKADYELEEEKEEGKEGEKAKKSKYKYPEGRRIIVGTDTLLDDGPIDVFPLITEPIADRSETLWGEDDVYRQISLQLDLNAKTNQVSQNIALTCNRQAVADDLCGIGLEEYAECADKPGMLFKLTGGTNLEDFHKHFEIMENSQFQPELFQYLYIVPEFMERVTGVTKLIQGLSAKRERQTGFEIGKMLETATIRLRERAAHVENFIRQIGLKCMQYVARYYTEPRPVWHVDNQTNDIVKNTYEFPKDKNKITGQDEPVDWEYDIIVQPDSTLPVDLNSQSDLAMRLKQLGVISNTELLKRLQVPHWEALPDQQPPAPPPPPTGEQIPVA